jgi:hypothetical protein
VQKAEDAADEALLKFGTNISQFLREAVTIAPPTADEIDSGKSKVLFESKDSEGKRVIHTTRFEAQLHVIHCSLDSFLRDPASAEFESWAEGFDAEKQTEDISRDLALYDELRRAMEKCVPEKVEYGIFWKRYYFLRHVIETEEKRRRELLKGNIFSVQVVKGPKLMQVAGAASHPSEDIAWDEDSEDENSTTPVATAQSTGTLKKPTKPETAEKDDDDTATLKPAEPRRSNDLNSMAGSDASYDIVSGANSRAPGSPTTAVDLKKVDESDEEDWE